MDSFHIWTIGCQMNQADSERLASALEQLGLHSVQQPRDADVVVLNSCVVRQQAEDKVTGTLGIVQPLRKSRPDSVLALMGCMVGPRSEELQRRFPDVDLFLRPQEYDPLLETGWGTEGRGLGRLRGFAGAGPSQRHLPRSHNPRVRLDVHLLHYPLPPWPPGEPSG